MAVMELCLTNAIVPKQHLHDVRCLELFQQLLQLDVRYSEKSSKFEVVNLGLRDQFVVQNRNLRIQT